MECECKQIWDVYEVEERQRGEAEFTLYATVEIEGDVRAGESFFEGDRCPTCGQSLGVLAVADALARDGWRLFE